MKKYQQLLLAILSIVSFSCLLIYRHEYNKLRYVLEVINFFGKPGVSTATPPIYLGNATFHKITPVNPIGAWQRVSNTLYIYSAYWETADDKEHVKAFAVGVLNENLNYGCYLWYDSNPKKKMGQFSFSGLAFKNQDSSYNVKTLGKGKTKAFVFYCETDLKGVIPVGVTFYKSSVNDTSQGFLPVISHRPGNPPPKSTAICVLPIQLPYLNKSTYLEFLSFHKLLGISDFIIYGGNNQYNLLLAVQSQNSNDMELTILQWNYPFFGDNELMKVIAENDCKTRATGLYENIVVLDWNKFLVPRYISNVSEILNELDHERKTFKFQFSTLLFCTEYEDDINSNLATPLVLKKTRYSLPKFDSLSSVYRPAIKSGRVQKVSKNIMAVHQYTSCHDFKLKKSDKIDNSMLKYQKELLLSKVLNI